MHRKNLERHVVSLQKRILNQLQLNSSENYIQFLKQYPGIENYALNYHIASYLGIPRGRAFSTQTANGRSTSYAANLDRVSVGEIELQNVRAAIAPGLQMEEVLLGMSFLKHIEFSQKGDTLILRQ